MAIQHLVLFENVKNGTALYKQLSLQGVDCKVSFSPPDLEKVCGIAIEYFDEADQALIQSIADDNNIPIKTFYDYSPPA